MNDCVNACLIIDYRYLIAYQLILDRSNDLSSLSSLPSTSNLYGGTILLII